MSCGHQDLAGNIHVDSLTSSSTRCDIDYEAGLHDGRHSCPHQWQPIEDKHKNGEEWWVYAAGLQWVSSFEDGVWDWFSDLHPQQPTHAMPLPEPPERTVLQQITEGHTIAGRFVGKEHPDAMNNR